MKYSFILPALLLFSNKPLIAQETPINTGMGIGFQLVQYQRDFGIGLNLSSPYFVYDNIALRLKGNTMFNETVIDGETTWLPYSNASLGIVGVGGMIGNRIRLYGEGGVVAIIPPAKISDKDMFVGGYGLFGFEFFFGNMGNYFIEIGGLGSGAKADKVPSKPIFSNGMTLSTGFRFFFK
jgi:hypothetical protein